MTSVTTEQIQAPVVDASPTPMVLGGPVETASVETAPKEEVVSSETVSTPEVKETISPEVEKMRRFQSDRDKAEAALKAQIEYTEKMKQFISFDANGNPIGPVPVAQATVTAEPQVTKEQIVSALWQEAQKGNAEAAMCLQEIQKNDIKEELLREQTEKNKAISEMSKVEDSIKKDFPALIGADGEFDKTSPLFVEMQTLATTEYKGILDPYNPAQLRILTELAEGKMLKKNLPEIEKKAKEELYLKVKRAGANASTPTTATAEVEDITAAIPADVRKALIERDGMDSAGLTRIAKYYKSANEKKGWVL